jgi:hypothetical protein
VPVPPLDPAQLALSAEHDSTPAEPPLQLVKW